MHSIYGISGMKFNNLAVLSSNEVYSSYFTQRIVFKVNLLKFHLELPFNLRVAKNP